MSVLNDDKNPEVKPDDVKKREEEIESLKSILEKEMTNVVSGPKEEEEYSEEVDELEEESDYYKFKTWEGRKTVFMRIKWSDCLVKVIWVIVIFDILMVAFIGWGWFDFTDKKDLVYLFVVESMLKIVGLAFIVVNFLFDRNNKEE